MAKLTIQRKGGISALRRFAYEIRIDGNRMGTIHRKQTKELELTNENHRVQIASNWWKSREILFDSNSPKIFQVAVNPSLYWTQIYLWIVMIVIILKDTTVDNTQLLPIKVGSNQMWMLAMPAFIIILYFFIVGRKNFLSELNLSLL